MAGHDSSRIYCLRCYEPMAPFADASRCAHCGTLNRRSDHSVFWTREPQLVAWERLAKIATLIVATGLGAALVQLREEIGLGLAWAVGGPAVTGLVLWEISSMITRRSPYFRSAILWSVVFAFAGLPLLGTSLAQELGPKARASLAVAGAGMVFLSVAMPSIGHLLAAWRERHVDGRHHAAHKAS